jgi:hypothetical protein
MTSQVPFILTEQSTEAIPEDVRRVFREAIQLYASWTPSAGSPAPTVQFRNLVVSLSGVCDLILGYKNDPLPTIVYDELWRSIDAGQISLKAELAMDPSYAVAAKCLDALVQSGRMTAAVSKALSAKDQMDFDV